ncbi:CaiB/BaiF CoA transferase family protein [Dactylosporangium sp. CA-092794]|uniref:CaiB/BaiF CoA transferase family protein n=1 Tax=Dactylosporangium sp. CA-092794 TaxID=3239929 RepID=UPI003D8C96E6
MFTLLAGITVLDLSRLIPGAYASQKLADLGADVIKVELPPAGDYLRSVVPLADGLSLMHIYLNRNKRSVALNLRSEEGRRAFAELVRSADVLIEAGRPGAAAAAGYGYEQVRQLRPDIVYCSLSAFGQSGPYADLPAHGAQMEAASGNINMDGPADRAGHAQAPNVRTFNASQSGALNAALAIAAALLRRQRTGAGAYLDVSCWQSAVTWQYGNLIALANSGQLFPGSEGIGARYGCYAAADGRWMMIGLIEAKFWNAFCRGVDRPDLATDDAGGLSYEADDRLAGELAGIFASRSSAEWVRFAIEHKLPIAPVLAPADLLTDPHAAHHGVFVDTAHPVTGTPVRVLAPPVKVAGEHFEIAHPAPAFGEHTAEILARIDPAA